MIERGFGRYDYGGEFEFRLSLIPDAVHPEI